MLRRVFGLSFCFLLVTGAVTAQTFDDFSTNPFEPGSERWGRNQNTDASTDQTVRWIAPGSDLCENADGFFQPFFNCGGGTQPPVNFPCAIYSEADIEGIGEDPATFGAVAITHGKGHSGNLYLQERLAIGNNRVRVILEATGGCRFDNPADGGGIVLAELQNPPGGGSGGGSNGLVGYVCPEGQGCHEDDGNGDGVKDGGQTIMFEMDYNGGTAGDFGNENHIGIFYAPQGGPAGQAPPFDIGVKIDVPNDTLIHNLKDVAEPCRRVGDQCGFEPNRFEIDALFKDGVTAVELNFIDQGVNYGRVAQFELPGFTPFEGYIIAAAATGGRDAATYLHEIEIGTSEGECDLIPGPATMTRNFLGLQTVECGDFVPGEGYSVNIELSNVRDLAACPLEQTVVRELLPVGFAASNASDGGVIIEPDDTDIEGLVVEWTLAPEDITDGKVLSFSVSVPEQLSIAGQLDEEGDIRTEFRHSGTASERGVNNGIVGNSRLAPTGGFDPFCGGINCWNILGPFSIGPVCSSGCAPTFDQLLSDIAAHDSDGDGLADVADVDLPWRPGLEVNTAFSALGENTVADGLPAAGKSLATGMLPTRDSSLNQGGAQPTVFRWTDADSFVNLNDDVFGQNPDVTAAYAQCYVVSDAEREVFIKADAARSFTIQLNGKLLFERNDCGNLTSCRSRSSACSRPRNDGSEGQQAVIPGFTDIAYTPDVDESEPIVLQQGVNNLIFKVLDGSDIFRTTFAFWFRFQDSDSTGGDANPITDGLEIRVIPPISVEIGAIPGDSNADGIRDLSDALALFNFLFLGGSLSECYNQPGVGLTNTGFEILNFNGDGGIDLSDGVADLTHQFLGGPGHALGNECFDTGDDACLSRCTR